MLPPNLLLDAVSAESMVVQATRTQRPDHLAQQEIQNQQLYAQEEELLQAGIRSPSYVPPAHPLTLQNEKPEEALVYTYLPFYMKPARAGARIRKTAAREIMQPSLLEIERDKGAAGYSVHNQMYDKGQIMDLIA